MRPSRSRTGRKSSRTGSQTRPGFVLGHDRRRVIHFEVAQNPTQAWLARQMTKAFPWDTAPRYLLRHRAEAEARSFARLKRRLLAVHNNAHHAIRTIGSFSERSRDIDHVADARVSDPHLATINHQMFAMSATSLSSR
jgi:hypothetical protein